MLDPREEYIDYADLLMPPPGYTLARAIGTTYSLDLRALLAIPVAMFYSKPMRVTGEDVTGNLDVFDSVSAASKLITIFCQKGKIKVPRKYNKLLCFTENCVREITPDNAFVSFHPKLWCMWFRKEKSSEKIIRFSVLSRNLTFDRSWDLSFSFEGSVTKEVVLKNRPIIDFLAYLEKKSGIKIEPLFKRDLERTAFKSELNLKDWTFHPIGFDDYRNPLERNLSFDTLLMMSPFADDETVIQTASNINGKKWLFSRSTELEKLKSESFKAITKSFCIPDIIVNGERNELMDEIETETGTESLDLHAKLYIGSRGSTFTWLLGSANLTRPAFRGNIECLLEIKSDDYSFRSASIYNELVSTETEKKLFEEFIPVLKELDSADLDISQKLREIEFSLICCSLTGEVIGDETGNYYSYSLMLDASRLKITEGFKIYIQLINSSLSDGLGILIKAGEINRPDFNQKFKVSQLSRYFVVNITYKGELERSFIIKADIINIPFDERENRVIAEIIDSQDKFLAYLRLLLSEKGIVDEAIELKNEAGRLKHDIVGMPIWERYRFPLFEELLKAASRQPEKLRRIDETIGRLSALKETESFITTELLQLWDVFKRYSSK